MSRLSLKFVLVVGNIFIPPLTLLDCWSKVVRTLPGGIFFHFGYWKIWNDQVKRSSVDHDTKTWVWLYRKGLVDKIWWQNVIVTKDNCACKTFVTFVVYNITWALLELYWISILVENDGKFTAGGFLNHCQGQQMHWKWEDGTCFQIYMKIYLRPLISSESHPWVMAWPYI